MGEASERILKVALVIALLLVNLGCVLLFKLIAINIEGAGFERTALSFAFQYACWAVSALFCIQLAFAKKLNDSRWVAVVLTVLNMFCVIGALASAIPFHL